MFEIIYILEVTEWVEKEYDKLVYAWCRSEQERELFMTDSSEKVRKGLFEP